MQVPSLNWTPHHKSKFWCSKYHNILISDKLTVLMSFLTQWFWFWVSALSHVPINMANVISYIRKLLYLLLYLVPTLFFLHDKHFETDENISFKTDESMILKHNLSSGIMILLGEEWWWIHFLFLRFFFSGGNCIWPLCFLFIIRPFSLVTSGETTSWITSVCLTVKIIKEDDILCLCFKNLLPSKICFNRDVKTYK